MNTPTKPVEQKAREMLNKVWAIAFGTVRTGLRPSAAKRRLRRSGVPHYRKEK